MGRDITDQRQAEDALRASEQRFKEFSELLPQAVYETDAKEVLSFANRPAIEWFGYAPEDFLQPFPIFRVISPEEREKAIQNFMGTLHGVRTAVGAEYTAIKKDGTRFTMMTYASPIIRDRKPVGLRGLALDTKEIVDIGGGILEYRLIGTGEPHGTSRFVGTFSTVSWRSLTNEYWNGFTLGIQGTAIEVPPCEVDPTLPECDHNGVSEPGSLALLGLCLLGLGIGRRYAR